MQHNKLKSIDCVCACTHIHVYVVFLLGTFTDVWYLLIGVITKTRMKLLWVQEFLI